MSKFAFPVLFLGIIGVLWFGFKSYTDPILAQHAMAKLEAINVNGDRQWILARGCDRRKPVLLFLHGGPGMPAMFTAHAFQRPLEKDFVVVHWDQRGAGKSFHGDLDPQTMTMTQMLADAQTVVEHLREKFGVQKVYLVGHSHGSFFGALLAQARPDLFYAFVGVGQIGDPAREHIIQDEIIRERLSARGAPLPVITPENRETLLFEIGGELANAQSMWPLLRIGFTAPEYSFTDAMNVAKGPQFARAHLRYDGVGSYGPPPAEFAIPLYVVMGARDAVTPVSLARAWFDNVRAPSKDWTEINNAAHFPHLEQPQGFAAVMNRVRHETAPLASTPDGWALSVPRFGLQCRRD